MYIQQQFVSFCVYLSNGQLYRPGDRTINLILSSLQDATTDLEKKIKRICDICKERQELAERERALTQRRYLIKVLAANINVPKRERNGRGGREDSAGDVCASKFAKVLHFALK